MVNPQIRAAISKRRAIIQGLTRHERQFCRGGEEEIDLTEWSVAIRSYL